MNDMYKWSCSSNDWVQDIEKKRFYILNRETKEINHNQLRLDFIEGAKRHPPSKLECSGFFPPEFTHCPYCGSNLLEPGYNNSELWIPPYGEGNGLKLYSKKLGFKKTGPIDKKAVSFPLPSRDGRFAFCSVKLEAKQRLLIAIQRDTGQLWVFQPDEEKKWEMLTGTTGGDTLPIWSWSLAVDSEESGLCTPTDQGPVWLTVNWSTSAITVDRAGGRSVGGAIRLGKNLFAPVLKDNSFGIVTRKEGDKAWSECPPASNSNPSEVLHQLCRNNNQDKFLGIPVIDEIKQVAYWPCRGGYVRVSGVDSSDGLVWSFRPWETDEYPATALIELGPPYRTIGSHSGFWQLCEDRSHSERDGIVDKIIKLDGDEYKDSEIVDDGQFLTTGKASFFWGDDYWDDIHRRTQGMSEQKELRFPMLQFGEKGLVLIAKVSPWDGRDEFGVFSEVFFNHNLKTTAFVRFVLEGSGISEKALYTEEVAGGHGEVNGSLFRVMLSHLPEIMAFIYADALYIYFPERNDCYCWPLN